MNPKELRRAKYEAELAWKKLEARLIEIQDRLQPSALTNDAWEGVKEKSSEIAGDAVQAVKARPIAVSVGLAAFTLFLARAPIKSAVSRYISGPDDESDDARADENSRKLPASHRQKDEVEE